jgi:carboxyl-terminal processing protease
MSKETGTRKKGAVGVFGGFVLAAIALPVGIALRDWRDVGTPTPTENVLNERTLVASTQPVAIPEADYFREVSALLKREYVDPVTDDQKLASGAVRGMIASLSDPNSIYMDKDAFRTALDQREGKFQGIGASFALVERGAANPLAPKTADGQPAESAEESLLTRVRVPRLMVVGLTPEGAAAKAGVRVGDLVYEIDQHWVANTDLLIRFQRAQKEFDAKKITLAQLNVIRKEVREKTERALMPLKAIDKLAQGKTGTIRVVWERDGMKRETTLAKALTTQVPNGTLTGKSAVLRFSAGAKDTLSSTLASGATTLDLRNGGDGDYKTMLECLPLVVPTGSYGGIETDRPEKPTPLTVKSGTKSPRSLTLLTDESTRGAGLIFAQVLQKSGIGRISGKQASDVFVRTTVALPDGSGYTLVTGRYREKPTAKMVASNASVTEVTK